MKCIASLCAKLVLLGGLVALTPHSALAQGRGPQRTMAFNPIAQTFIPTNIPADRLTVMAGVDRDVMIDGKTYLNGYAGYGAPRVPGRGNRGGGGGGFGRGRGAATTATQAMTPAPTPEPVRKVTNVKWSKAEGPGDVKFADAMTSTTTATFSKTGNYTLKFTATDNGITSSSTLIVKVVEPPPSDRLDVVYTKNYSIDNPLWNSRVKALIVGWIPHCIDQINDPSVSTGGMDNFDNAAKALKGEPYAPHKGYVFANAWVHQTVESMSLALMVDAKGDPEILAAQDKFRKTLDDWIPRILAAQEPDGYLQTAFTARANPETNRWQKHWTVRGNHEGYTGGYFLESAINNYTMTGGKDKRLYNAAKKLADCWANSIGSEPGKQQWYDGHEEMEQALVRFGRFVNDMEGSGHGDRYIKLSKFLLDCRYTASGPGERDDYDQDYAPVTQQYEAQGHAVRAAYLWSGMADVAAETHDVDYQSAVMSLWDNVTNKKLYLTGGVGSGETSEGFGPNYSLQNNAYCESCANCGELFFQWKMNLAYHDAKYADLYEDTLYNAVMGDIDLDGKNLCYTNTLSGGNNRQPWQGCPCCVGNTPRTMLMIPTWSYAKGKDALYVNLFIGSTVNIEKFDGMDVQMIQKTNYPWDGKVSITVNPSESKNFSLMVRVPNREVSELYKNSPEVSGMNNLTVNGTKMTPQIEKGYAVIKRTWKKGDVVSFELPLKAQLVTPSDKIPADRGRVAMRYGPLIYNIESVDHPVNEAISKTSPLSTSWKGDLLQGVMVINGKFASGANLQAVPYYARYNRDPARPGRGAAPQETGINYLGPNSDTTAAGQTAANAGARGGRGNAATTTTAAGRRGGRGGRNGGRGGAAAGAAGANVVAANGATSATAARRGGQGGFGGQANRPGSAVWMLSGDGAPTQP